jgi:hypothetical protein
MNIIYKPISELIPYVNNPRKNDNAVDAVASSIKNYGFRQPIVIDGKNEIIIGHTRLLAAKKLKMESVPCAIVDDLTPQEIKGLRIADNKVAEYSEWDMDLLKIELDGLDEFTGFEIDGLDINNFNEDFTLPDGEKEPFQQMTFVLADKQIEFIKEKLSLIKKTESNVYNFGNENSNGNAFYRMVLEWAELKI